MVVELQVKKRVADDGFVLVADAVIHLPFPVREALLVEIQLQLLVRRLYARPALRQDFLSLRCVQQQHAQQGNENSFHELCSVSYGRATDAGNRLSTVAKSGGVAPAARQAAAPAATAKLR